MNVPVKAATFVPAVRDLHEPTYAELAHLPGLKPHPLPVLRTIEFLRNPLQGVRDNVARFGHVYRVNNFGGWNVGLIGPDANELVLFDKDKNFSSDLGWTPILGRVFPARADAARFRSPPSRPQDAVGRLQARTDAALSRGSLNEGIARGIKALPVG